MSYEPDIFGRWNVIHDDTYTYPNGFDGSGWGKQYSYILELKSNHTFKDNTMLNLVKVKTDGSWSIDADVLSLDSNSVSAGFGSENPPVGPVREYNIINLTLGSTASPTSPDVLEIEPIGNTCNYLYYINGSIFLEKS